jgi:branched-chain amino acid transport system substrate-binding protein
MFRTRLLIPLLLLLVPLVNPTPAAAHVTLMGPEDGLAVGVLYPHSGDLSSVGGSAAAAFEGALTDLNHHLSQNGYQHRLKLLLYDTGSNSDGALAGLQELDSLGVKLVIGPYTSSECAAVLSYANAHDLLLLSPASTATSLSLAGDNLLRLTLDDTVQAQAIASLMWQEGRRAYLPVWRGELWSDELESRVASQFASLGGVVLEGVRYDSATSDFNLILDQLDAKVTQAVASYGASQVGVNLLAYQDGVSLLAGANGRAVLDDVTWYGGDGLARNTALLANRQAAAFAARVGLESPLLYQTQEVMNTPRQVLQDIVLREEMSALVGTYPTAGAYESWDAVWLAGLSYAANGFSGGGGALRQALTSQANQYTGMSGVLKLNQAGDRVYGDYAFYSVAASGSSPAWRLSAAYSAAYGPTDGVKFIAPWSAPNTSDSPSVYKVGVLLNQAQMADTSASVLAGLELALGEINTHFSLYGYSTRLELVTYDTNGDPARTADRVQFLADMGVKAIIGPLTSAECAAALPLANQLGVMLVSPSSDAAALSIAGDNLYRMAPDVRTQSRALAQLMWRQGRRAMVSLYRDDIWGQSLAQLTAQAFQDLGGVVLGQVGYATSGGYDQALASLSQRIQASGYGKDQLAVQLACLDEGVALLGQANANSGLKQAYWYGNEALSGSGSLLGAGAAAQFAQATGLTTMQYALQIPGVVAGIPASLTIRALNTRIQASLGSQPQSYASTAWDGLWLTALAAVNNGWSSSAATLGAQFKDTAGGYIGLSNNLALNASGDRNYGNYDFLSPSSGSWRTTYSYFTTLASPTPQLVAR